jgi:hypothetical protein
VPRLRHRQRHLHLVLLQLLVLLAGTWHQLGGGHWQLQLQECCCWLLLPLLRVLRPALRLAGTLRHWDWSPCKQQGSGRALVNTCLRSEQAGAPASKNSVHTNCTLAVLVALVV